MRLASSSARRCLRSSVRACSAAGCCAVWRCSSASATPLRRWPWFRDGGGRPFRVGPAAGAITAPRDWCAAIVPRSQQAIGARHAGARRCQPDRRAAGDLARGSSGLAIPHLPLVAVGGGLLMLPAAYRSARCGRQGCLADAKSLPAARCRSGDACSESWTHPDGGAGPSSAVKAAVMAARQTAAETGTRVYRGTATTPIERLACRGYMCSMIALRSRPFNALRK